MEPIKLELNLDLDAFLIKFRGYNSDGEEIVESQTFEELIFERAAQILAQLATKDKDNYKSLIFRVREITNEEIRNRVIPMVNTALSTPLKKTNTYGEAIGPEITMRELIVEQVHDYLTKPSKNSISRENRTNVQEFINNEVKKVVDKELRESLDKARQEVAIAVKDQAAEMIQKTIAKMADVK